MFICTSFPRFLSVYRRIMRRGNAPGAGLSSCASGLSAALFRLRRGWPLKKNGVQRNVHGGHADRLRHPSGGGRNAHDAVALSRRPLERAGGQPGDRRPRPQLLSASTCRCPAAPTGARRRASPAATSRWCSAARSTSSARRMRSAMCCTARRRCSTPIWRRPSARRSTTGSRPNGCRKDSRLRASIVIPLQAPDLAIEEIERRAADNRFVSVLVLAQGENLLGRRHYWPVWQAAEKHKLPIAIHAGSQYRSAPVRSAGRPIATNITWRRRRRSRPRCSA